MFLKILFNFSVEVKVNSTHSEMYSKDISAALLAVSYVADG